MSKYKELLAQRENLDKAIAEAREAELSDAIGKVKALVEEFGLTSTDIFGSVKPRAQKASNGKVAPKFKDPATGATWTGRGKAPKWIAGKDRAGFTL
jgi:DNA-binding protein H-NS